jgi:hypothetical protein
MDHRELSQLKYAHLLERLSKSSGLSREQMIAVDIKESEKALSRMQEIQATLPTIKHIDVVFKARNGACSAYTATRNIGGGGVGTKSRAVKMYVLAGTCVKDNKLWYHVSFSRLDRIMPTYQDLTWIKQVFFGDEFWAIQVFPKKEHYVSDHNTTLHLWHCLEEFPLPDFRMFGTI